MEARNDELQSLNLVGVVICAEEVERDVGLIDTTHEPCGSGEMSSAAYEVTPSFFCKSVEDVV